MKLIGYLILTAAIIFNLWLYFPETQILADPNDNIFQYSLVYRTNWVWENYGCPLSLSCLPNLIDHNVPTWAEGYPLPFYYTHIPQIVTVASYHLFIKPLFSLFSFPATLYAYYNWTKYLLLAFFPTSVFLALLLVGFSPFTAALTALFSSHFSTDGLYAADPTSFLWRGYGLTSQLYALFFLPLALAFTYRALAQTTNNRNVFWAIVFLTATTAGHLGIGIIGLLSTLPFLFFDLTASHLKERLGKIIKIYAGVFFLLAYWIIPILLENKYHIISFWDPIWKFNSYGADEVVRQFFQGEIFDFQRAPILTYLVIIGFFVTLLNTKLFPFSLLFVLWILFYFGRTTWGGLIDLIPGMKDFHQHRFIVGVHIASLFLLPASIGWIWRMIGKTINWLTTFITSKAGTAKNTEGMQFVFSSLLFTILFSIIIFFTISKTIDYARLNTKWIGEANNAYRYDEKNFQDLLAYLNTLPSGRIYAGRPGNWGKDFRLGSTQLYMLFGITGHDISQFLPETWSPLSENEQNFDERVLEDFNLLNIRYVVAPKNYDFPKEAKLAKKFGPFELYEVPTTGWFDIVTSPEFVKTDKNNYINIVHLWQRSYPRRWNMYPLISVEKNPDIPEGVKRVITMTDEVTYQENKQVRNIFADYPFVFPEATVSGKIKSEKVKGQTYETTVEVPDNCTLCFAMFKMSYHPNWQVKVDGNVVSKYAVFPYYLAAPVTPGTHTVEFTYYPSKLKIILLSLEIILGLLFLFRKKIKIF